MKALSVAILALAAFAATPVSAEVSLVHSSDGYTYFNKPGADWAAHNAAFSDCWGEASNTRTSNEVIGNNQGLFAAGMTNFEQKRGVQVNLENCMVATGWRVVQVTEAEGAALSAQTWQQLSAGELTGWVGAETPHGQIVRSWANDAANGATVRTDVRPNYSGRPSLSLLAQNPGAQIARTRRMSPVQPPKSAQPQKFLKEKDLAGVAPGSAMIILNFKGVGFKNGIGLILVREGPDLETPAWMRDQLPAQINAGVALISAKADGNLRAFTVAPGRWRIESLFGLAVLNFCLGAPAFEVKAGEVVFAGTMDFKGPDLSPDMDMTPGRTFLASRPDLAANMRPAVYENGNPGLCDGSYIYALEFTGAAKAQPPVALTPPAAASEAVTTATPAG